MSGATKLMTAGGGGVSLTPASSIASDVTVNIPSQDCTLGIQGPAFSAYQSSAQTIANNTSTKIQFQTEEFDTANCFDNVTNYRFTPNVAGYYLVESMIAFTNLSSYACLVGIYKNGSAAKYGNTGYAASNFYGRTSVSAIIYMNGSTDYIEAYASQVSGSNNSIDATSMDCYFQAALVRAA